jgi:hypothetical protein
VNRVALLDGEFGDDAADEASCAGYEDVHCVLCGVSDSLAVFLVAIWIRGAQPRYIPRRILGHRT